MHFAFSAELLALQTKTRQFIAESVIPLEHDRRQTAHGPSPELRQALLDLAREHGLLTPHAAREMGGLGLSHVEKAKEHNEVAY